MFIVTLDAHRPPSPREVMRALVPGRRTLCDPEGNAGYRVWGEPEPQGDGEPTPALVYVWVPIEVATRAYLRLARGGTLD